MPSNGNTEVSKPSYIEFAEVPFGTIGEDGKPMLNRFSAELTRGHDFPGAQVSKLDEHVCND